MRDNITMEVLYQEESRPPRTAIESYIWPAQIRVSTRLCPQGTHSTCILYVRLPSSVLPVILYQASWLLKKQELNTVLHGPDTPSSHLAYCQTVNLQGSAKATHVLQHFIKHPQGPSYHFPASSVVFSS